MQVVSECSFLPNDLQFSVRLEGFLFARHYSHQELCGFKLNLFTAGQMGMQIVNDCTGQRQ